MIDTASRNGRSETEIIGRSGIAVAMGDATYWLRPLTMDQAEEWERQIVALIGTSLTSLGGLSGIDGLLGIMRQGVDAMLDALYKYDELGSETPALPDRFILRKQASRDDLYQALRKLVKHEFPPLTSAEVIGTWVPAGVREIITTRLLMLLPSDESPPEPSSSVSSESIPGRPNRQARRASGKS